MQGEFWESIEDMPLYNWHKCLDGKLEYVHKELKITSESEKHWEFLYNELTEFKGIAPKEQKLFNAIKRKALLECEYLRTGNRMNITLIDIEEQKIKAIRDEEKEVEGDYSIEKTLIKLGQWLGYRLDWKQISVKEFYLIIDEYGKQNN